MRLYSKNRNWPLIGPTAYSATNSYILNLQPVVASGLVVLSGIYCKYKY